jgi:hypothetical protein
MSATELNCKGSCISYCYYKYSIIFILVGIIIGYVITNYMKHKPHLVKEKVI